MCNPADGAFLSLFLFLSSSYGFSVIGPKFSEEKLVGICYAVEQLTRARDRADSLRLPQFQ